MWTSLYRPYSLCASAVVHVCCVCLCVWLRADAVCAQLGLTLQAESRVQQRPLSAAQWLSRGFRSGREWEVWGAPLTLLPLWPLKVRPDQSLLSLQEIQHLCRDWAHYGCSVGFFWFPISFYPSPPPPPPPPAAAAPFLSACNSLHFLKSTHCHIYTKLLFIDTSFVPKL